MTISKLDINLEDYLGDVVVCTLRNGDTLQGKVEKKLDQYGSTHPYRISEDQHNYRPEGSISCLIESSRDIISINPVNQVFDLKEYLGDRVICTLRNGATVEGIIELSETSDPPFPPGTNITNPYTLSGHSYAYNSKGRYRGTLDTLADILSIKRIGPVTNPIDRILKEMEKLSADEIREIEEHIKELKDTDSRFLRGYKVEICVRFSECEDFPKFEQMKQYVEALLIDKDAFSHEFGVDSSDISLAKISEIGGQSLDQFEWSNT